MWNVMVYNEWLWVRTESDGVKNVSLMWGGINRFVVCIGCEKFFFYFYFELRIKFGFGFYRKVVVMITDF